MAKKWWNVLVFAMLVSALPSLWASVPLGTGASFDAGFSPSRGALDVVLKGIRAAKKQILVAGYMFTSKPIAAALVEAHRRGVQVFVVVDAKENQGKYSAATFLANADVPVRLNANYKIFHHKFMVLDGTSLQLGSFNYTAAAEKNAENALLLSQVPDLAAAYASEWKRLWDEAVVLPKAY